MVDLNKVKKIALVGATTNKEKFGYIILKDLISKGFEVIPVTPKYEEIEGIKVAKTIKELEEDVDLIVFVVPPKVGAVVTREVLERGFKNLWYQPGAYSSEIEEILKQSGVEVVRERCIMVETRR
ncbi:CoA-binding protein [Thermosipho sp. 1074]|uniref:CoA-binding protein n=1 Tax=Thermosipho sp. 1074 TaxID=1643331 RepID=UPI000985A5D5|nr:CoA-binding protein [Thermosipho sp. 1074]OOC43418.1 CoA-binding protein [Thermosipho sp. 1074]